MTVIIIMMFAILRSTPEATEISLQAVPKMHRDAPRCKVRCKLLGDYVTGFDGFFGRPKLRAR